jgi:HAMP domain-containing protein
MSLQSRIVLLVGSLLMIAVIGTTAALTWSARQDLLDQTEMDGQVIAALLARSATFAEQVPEDIEAVIGDQMVAQATITAHLVAIAEAAGLTPDEVNAILRDITDRTTLAEFWITDANGHAYLLSESGIDFTFSPDAAAQPQASAFWPLLTGDADVVVQDAQRREIDEGVFKYVGVAGVDQPRIVQVGTSATLLDQLAIEMGPARLANEIVSGGNVSSIRILDHQFQTVAFSAPDGSESPVALDWTQVSPSLRGAIAAGETASLRGEDDLQVVAPIMDAEGHVTGAVMVTLPTTRLQEALRESLVAAALVAASVLAIGVLASLLVARWVTQPVDCLTDAASAVETGNFDPDSIAAVARRTDGLGNLARTFQEMAREVQAREQRLKAQVQVLTIEIDRAREARLVAEITETDYFQQLKTKAQALRARPATGGKAD